MLFNNAVCLSKVFNLWWYPIVIIIIGSYLITDTFLQSSPETLITNLSLDPKFGHGKTTLNRENN